ncbi:phage tail tape measure C-terminal domain-containing protein, partial [Vibrio coralliilyticus]
IAVTSTMMMNPLQIALQQGTQISAVLGLSGAAGSVKALGAALRSVMSPMSLLTIAAVAGVSALIQWGQQALGSTKTAATLSDTVGELNQTLSRLDTLDAHASGVNALTQQYGTLTTAIRHTMLEQMRLNIEIAKLESHKLSKAVNDALRALGINSQASGLRPQAYFKNGLNLYGGMGIKSVPSYSAQHLMKNLGLTEKMAIRVQDRIHAIQTGEGDIQTRYASLASVLKDVEGAMSPSPDAREAFLRFENTIQDSIRALQTLNQEEKKYHHRKKAGFDTPGYKPPKLSGVRSPTYRPFTLRNPFYEHIKSMRQQAKLADTIRQKQAAISKTVANYRRELEKVAVREKAIAAFNQQIDDIKQQQMEHAGALARREARDKGMDAQGIQAAVDEAKKAASNAFRFDSTMFGLPEGTSIEAAGQKFGQEFVDGWVNAHPEKAIRTSLQTWVDDANNTGKQMDAVMTRAASGMTDAITQFVMTGKASFKDFARSVIADLTRIVVRQSLVAPIVKSLGFDFSAKGNAFSQGVKLAFAQGGVVARPTVFAMANGRTGLMGEAGPEAILPLSRDARGRLGVSAANAGGQAPNIQVNVINQTHAEAQARSQARYDAQLKQWVVDVVLEDVQRGGRLRSAFPGVK